MNAVIIGSGPAGIFAAEALRSRGASHRITILTRDDAIACSPVMLPYWMSGHRPRGSLFFRDPDWAETLGIEAILGSRISRIDPGTRSVRMEDGRELPYDRLLIATGAAPIRIPLPGSDAAGVFSLRGPRDAEEILETGPDPKPILIMGGGFIGLKLACHLKERGFEVAVIEKEERLAARALDRPASRIVEERIRRLGIRVETGAEIEKIVQHRGSMTGIVLSDGRMLPGAKLIQAVGVRPNTELLAGTGIRIERGGALVDDRMETGIPGIYAAGDVAVTRDTITGSLFNNAIWPAATRQGIVAGLNMAGGDRRYRINFPFNALELQGLRIYSAGHPSLEGTEGVASAACESGDRYRKVLTKENRVIGFILVGDIRGGGFLLNLMKKGADVSCSPSDLLRPVSGGSDRFPRTRSWRDRLIFSPYEARFG